MIDQYYDYEDIPPDDADTAVELYEQQIAPLAVNDAVSETQTLLSAIWYAAADAGRQDIQDALITIDQRVKTLFAHVGHQQAALAGAAAAIKAVCEQRDDLSDDLEALLQHMQDGTWNWDDRLTQFVENIEAEYAEIWREAEAEDVYENFYNEVGHTLRHMQDGQPGIGIISAFLGILAGDRQPTPEQVALLRQLLATIPSEADHE